MIAHHRDPDGGDALEQEIAQTLRDDYLDACHDAPIPSAGLVWWRANLRARAENAQKVERPLSVTHGVIGASIAGAACAAVGAVWQWIPAIHQPSPVIVVGLALAVGIVVAPLALVLTLGKNG